jgi:hypothetical protein
MTEPTSEEWMQERLTIKDIDDLERFLHATGGTKSRWPWPLIDKVLGIARSEAGTREVLRSQDCNWCDHALRVIEQAQES